MPRPSARNLPSTRSGVRTAVELHRERQRARGLVRLELQVNREDVSLLRQLAQALADPARAEATRAMLRSRLAPPPAADLKALLESAPCLEGLDMERGSDLGRDIAF
jgi:hypothetical protein